MTQSTEFISDLYTFGSENMNFKNMSEMSTESSIQHKQPFFSPILSKKDNFLLFVLFILIGSMYKYTPNLLTAGSLDISIHINAISLYNYVQALFYIANVITIFFLVFFSFIKKKFPYYIITWITLIGQLIISIGAIPLLTPIYNLVDESKLDTNLFVQFQLGIMIVEIILNGVFSAMNFSTIIYISSSLSVQHLLGYLIGCACGEFLSSFVVYLNAIIPHRNNIVYLIISVICYAIIPISIMIFFKYCYKKILHFQSLFQYSTPNEIAQIRIDTKGNTNLIVNKNNIDMNEESKLIMQTIIPPSLSTTSEYDSSIDSTINGTVMRNVNGKKKCFYSDHHSKKLELYLKH